MIRGLSRTSRVKRVNVESSLFHFNDVVFREKWNSKSIMIRDLPPLIDVNCAHDPPLRPFITPRKITLLKHKSRTKQRTDAGKNVVISRTSVSRFEEERKLNQNEG